MSRLETHTGFFLKSQSDGVFQAKLICIGLQCSIWQYGLWSCQNIKDFCENIGWRYINNHSDAKR